MKIVRDSGFVISLALLASLIGHFAIQQRFERRTRALLSLVQAQQSALANQPSFSPEMDLPEIGELKLPRILDDSSSFGRILPALEIQEEKHSLPANQPPAVPPPADADPIRASTNDESVAENSNSSGVREVIEDELSHASRDEREIWFDELKTLPPAVVRELLQVRKQLHALPRLLGGMPGKLASVDVPMAPQSHEIAAEPASQKIQFNLPDHQPAGAALEKAISQLRHNLANAATPGFKRLRVTLVDAYGSGWQESSNHDNPQATQSVDSNFQGQGCKVAPLSIDLKQGSLKKTDRQFDLAIDGDGFFVVHGGDKDYLTRCGAFTVDRDRHLCLAISNENLQLQPVITVPNDAGEIQISAQGLVTALTSDETTMAVIGQVQLARVPSPARLLPAGNSLFLANESSGKTELRIPMSHGLGEIHQCCLEQSNVNFEKELEEIETMTMILKALPPQISHSATARSLHHAPQR